MNDEIIALEADFANNEYFGTNVWTEEKYRVLSGNVPVLLSAPHSVNQIRGEDVRDAEKYTGALTRFLANATSSYAIFQIFTHADPNTDEENVYKNAVVNLVNSYNIKLLLDIHSSTFKDNTDMDIVTNNRETLRGMDYLFDRLKELGVKYNIKIDENNVPSLICGIPAMRIVINNKRLETSDEDDSLENIISLMEEFISYFNYS